MAGYLVDPSFVRPVVTKVTMNLASLFWGMTLACSVFSAAKAFRQARMALKRSGRLTPYVLMVWTHWVCDQIGAAIIWLYLWGAYEDSFQLWFMVVLIWTIQTQLFYQILINRIALLRVDRRFVNRLKWSTAIIQGVINISVFVIWIPTRLAVPGPYHHINEVWDRIEKCIFLFVDGGLNAYFIYQVRTRLIAMGLTKYNRLFWFNIFIACFSVSLDITLIGMMSMPDPVVYVQFQELAYIIKLHIEITMAELIAKIVRDGRDDRIHISSKHGHYIAGSGSREKSKGGVGVVTSSANARPDSFGGTNHSRNTFAAGLSRGAGGAVGYRSGNGNGNGRLTHMELGSEDAIELDQSPSHPDYPAFEAAGFPGIQKTTVVMQTVHESNVNKAEKDMGEGASASSIDKSAESHVTSIC